MTKYVRDLELRRTEVEVDGVRFVFVETYGKALYDPDRLINPHLVPQDQIADPNDPRVSRIR